MSDYFAIKALSASALQLLKESPEAFRDRYLLGIKEPESDAFRIGSAVHCLVLEPSCFADRYATSPKFDRRTKIGKEEFAKFQESAQGKIVLDSDEAAEVLQLAQAFNKHAGLVTLLASPGKVIEEPILFELFGEQFKTKPDCVIPSCKCIIDVKTCKNANPDRWKWSALDYGYHRQAAIYIEACQVKYGQRFRFLFACVSKTYPFEVSVIELDNSTIADGLDDTQRLVESYKRRMQNNDWLPNHSKGIVPLRLPRVLVPGYEEE
jgi:hypothetical protein